MPRATILLAEDDSDMRRFLAKALQNAGHDVVAFDNGRSAYERIREEPFTLLLTDLQALLKSAGATRPRKAEVLTLSACAARVQRRVEPHTWDAFRLLALEGCSGAEAAGKLGMKVATVFVARSKVQKLLRQELAKLDEPVPD